MAFFNNRQIFAIYLKAAVAGKADIQPLQTALQELPFIQHAVTAQRSVDLGTYPPFTARQSNGGFDQKRTAVYEAQHGHDWGQAEQSRCWIKLTKKAVVTRWGRTLYRVQT